MATLSEAAFAKTLKDPCFVATAGVTQCDGENCAVDPKITLKGPWQRVANCLRPLRDRWAKDGAAETVNAGGKQVPVVDALRETIYRSMTQSNAGAALVADPGRYVPIETVLNPDLSLKQDVARIAQLNDRGQPYSSMSQTNIARTLFAFAALAKRGGYPEAEADRKNYDRLARAVVAAVLAPVSQGGLATTTPCAKAPDMTCTWFHAVTRKDIDTAQGGTLNKNLHAIRNLILIDRAAARTGGERDPALAAGAAAGLNQLFLAEGHDAAGKTPNLKDFLVDQDGD
ncbi:MAG TPA: hypothetical protein PKE16_17405, partial [Hyphomicrobium sp.]|nr:hypothetical protein [Hyphomicrobium sp.]